MTLRHLFFAAFAVFFLACPVSAQEQTGNKIFEPESILAMMHKINDYNKAHPYRESDRSWIRGTWYAGVMDAYHATGDERYLKQAQQWAKKHEWQVGQEQSGFNRLFCAMTWVELDLLDPAPHKIAPTIAALKEKVPYSPAGAKVWYGHAPGPWDKPVYADALFSAPVFTMLAKATGDHQYIDILNAAFWDVTDKIFDKDENLYYRDPSYIGQKSPHGNKIIWSRGNGWVFAGLPRLLKYLPKDDPSYQRYVDLYQRMAKAVAARQSDDGFWRANLNDPWHYTMPETSGTAFFLAGFSWGVREGILDRDTYLPVVIRGWSALVSAVYPDGLLGWVQPIDGQPRPSHPKTTQEYAVGPMLSAGGQLYLLAKQGVIDPAAVHAAIIAPDGMLPPAALKGSPLAERDHPLSEQITAFLSHQKVDNFQATGFKKRDYLEVIAGQVKAMQGYQSAEGRIIDPVVKTEMYFTTPCYAHGVAVLLKAGYPAGKDLVESGMKALDIALEDLASDKFTGSHGDFYTWPIVFAMELFEGATSAQRRKTWEVNLGRINAATAYRQYRRPLKPSDHKPFYAAFGPGFANNWNLVNTAGEWGRTLHGAGDPWYVDYCMTMQLPNFSPFGMYREHGEPLAYDLFPRHYLTGMLQRGYRSFAYTTYRDILWRGGWSSLFMQSPFGELPAGFRSSHHIWNEVEQAVVFEIYASAYAKAGRIAEAGAFKRAANLSLTSIKQWIRPDGTGYIVKNRFPKEAKHGYEGYSVHTCYNMLAMSMLAQAWQFADDGVLERPAPADVGGFVFAVPEFHKIFANAAGSYIEYDTNGDQSYNPTGLLRVHIKGGNPQLGPSDGCAKKYSGEGNTLAVGPSWQNDEGHWVSLAEHTGRSPVVEVLRQSTDKVSFKVIYPGLATIKAPSVPVTDENTVAVDGSASWFSEAPEAGKWQRRSFNNEYIYEVLSASGGKSGCDLKTTLTGLEPGKEYEIGVLNGVRENEGWQVLCGLSSDRGKAVLSRGMKEMTATITRRTAFHSLIHEAQKLIGSAKAAADGTIAVYTFIPEDADSSRRCWLVGFTCHPVGTEKVPPSVLQLSETFTINSGSVTVENTLEGEGASKLRISYPMLVFDGKERTTVDMKENSVKLTSDGKSTRFTVLEPAGCQLQRSGKEIQHRNGVVEEAFAETENKRIIYRITVE